MLNRKELGVQMFPFLGLSEVCPLPIYNVGLSASKPQLRMSTSNQVKYKVWSKPTWKSTDLCKKQLQDKHDQVQVPSDYRRPSSKNSKIFYTGCCRQMGIQDTGACFPLKNISPLVPCASPFGIQRGGWVERNEHIPNVSFSTLIWILENIKFYYCKIHGNT